MAGWEIAMLPVFHGKIFDLRAQILHLNPWLPDIFMRGVRPVSQAILKWHLKWYKPTFLFFSSNYKSIVRCFRSLANLLLLDTSIISILVDKSTP
jgi:hypothetical protein